MSSKGVNKVILIGNLGNEPEVRYTPAGAAVANISLATNDAWQDKQTGEWQERTEWHRVVFFGRQAEVVKQYLHKGSQIYLEGRIQTRKWQDQSGMDRYTTEIIALSMQMLDKRDNVGAGYGAPTTNTYPYVPQPTNNYAAPPSSQSQTYPVNPNRGQGEASSSPTPDEDKSIRQPIPSPATGPNTPAVDKGFDEDVPF